ncbi:hypothetical protein ACFCYC_26100 [Streptomyces sp. NPDC056402]|uniref:hypothetical protein n=1 Tax=Streptomyces sp. NPDC056402 TaxID=3345810 RepID=UPI0035DFF1A0
MPVGFDAGLLHVYSLRVPEVAACVRARFGDILDMPAGRIGALAAPCEMLQSVARGKFADIADIADIADALMNRAQTLAGRRPPRSTQC